MRHPDLIMRQRLALVDREGALLRRLAALERENRLLRLALATRAARAAAHFSKRNASRQLEADRLDAAITAVLAGHPRAHELTARQIREQLAHDGYSPLPSLRAFQWHLKGLRGGDCKAGHG